MGQRFSKSRLQVRAFTHPSTWILEPEASTFAENSFWSNKDVRSLLNSNETLSGNELLWAWLSAFNSAVGFFATLGVNMPNFTVSDRILYSTIVYPSDNKLRDMRREKGCA
jgi:hypothetical protein